MDGWMDLLRSAIAAAAAAVSLVDLSKSPQIWYQHSENVLKLVFLPILKITLHILINIQCKYDFLLTSADLSIQNMHISKLTLL